MLTRKRISLPNLDHFARVAKSDEGKAALASLQEMKRVIQSFLDELNESEALEITKASLSESTVEDTPVGQTTPAAGSFTSLTVEPTSGGANLSGYRAQTGSASVNGDSVFGLAGYGWDGDSAEAAATMDFRATETWSSTARGSRIQWRAVAPTTTTLTEYGSLDHRGLLSEVSLLVKDGISEPSTASGYAAIYVDTADGDLKVKFGDGTVKTIVADT